MPGKGSKHHKELPVGLPFTAGNADSSERMATFVLWLTTLVAKATSMSRYPASVTELCEQSISTKYLNRTRNSIQQTLEDALHRVKKENELRPCLRCAAATDAASDHPDDREYSRI